MFFSVINYYTKTNKKIALNYSETKNCVRKMKINKTLWSLCENKKNKLRRGVVGSPCPLCLCVRT